MGCCSEFAEMFVATLARSRCLLEELLGSFFPEELAMSDAHMIRLTKINEYDAKGMADDAFDECDADSSGAVDYSEFEAWATAHPTFVNFLNTHEKLFVSQ
jgi:hypothetical protein